MSRLIEYRVQVVVTGPGGVKADADFRIKAPSLKEAASKFEGVVYENMEVVGITEWDRY